MAKLSDMSQWMAQNAPTDAEIHSETFKVRPGSRAATRAAADNRAMYEAKRTERIQKRLEAAIHWSPTPAYNPSESTGGLVPMAKMGLDLGPQTDDQGVTWCPVAVSIEKTQPGDIEYLRERIEAAKARQQQQAGTPAQGAVRG